jgi:hypothetical protein
MRLGFSQHHASVAYCSISRLDGILGQRPLNRLRPLDVERNVRKVSSVLRLEGLRAAMNFDCGAFVAFRCGLNR